MEETLMDVLNLLNEIMNDDNVAKNIRKTMHEVIGLLNDEDDIRMKCDRAMQCLSITDDPTIDSFTRTQVWSVISMLESITR